MTGLRTVSSGLDDFTAWATDTRPRIGLGLPFFDGPTRGGLAKAECAMFLSYSSVGKTWLGLNTIANNPEVPTVFFSIEMSWRQVVSRLTAITTGMPTWDLEASLRGGNRPPQLDETLFKFRYLLGDDSSEMSLKQMNAQIDKASNQMGQQTRLVIIDYLELISGNGLLGKSEQVDRAAQKIRALAKDNDCSVVVLHQVGKTDGDGGHEALSLDSGKYGGHHPMDAVIGMYAPRLNKRLSPEERREVRSDVWLQLLKNRNGQAEHDGVRHTLSPETGKITPFGLHVPGGYKVQPELTYYEDRAPGLDADEHMQRVFG